MLERDLWCYQKYISFLVKISDITQGVKMRLHILDQDISILIEILDIGFRHLRLTVDQSI